MCRSLPHSLPAAAVASRPAKGIRAQVTKTKSMVPATSQPTAPAGTGGQRQEEVLLLLLPTRCWGKECPFLRSQERRIQPRAITLGRLPVCATLGHSEAVKCSTGDKSPLQVFGQLTLIIINFFKLNTFLALLKWVRKKYITSDVQTLPLGMFS